MTDEQYAEIHAFAKNHSLPELGLGVELVISNVDEEPQLLTYPARVVLSLADYQELLGRIDAGRPAELHGL